MGVNKGGVPICSIEYHVKDEMLKIESREFCVRVFG